MIHIDTFIKKIGILIILVMTTLLTVACSEKKDDRYPVEDREEMLSKVQKTEEINYTPSLNGKKSDVISSVITDRKVLSLTFQGLADDEMMKKLLDELDKFNIKATFFVSGVKVAEDTDVAKMVIERGHEIGNSTLSGDDLTKKSYAKKVSEILKSHKIIEDKLGIKPKYLRPGHGAVDEEVRLATAQVGYENIINYNINPQDWEDRTPEEISMHIDEKKKRGGIIVLDAEKNSRVDESIALIYEKLAKKGYELIPLKDLVHIYEERKANQYISDNSIVKVNSEYNDEKYKIIKEGSRNEKKIALTFDDWGSDDTLDSILDTLDKYDVKATFFFRAKGVESNPSLAYAISQRGHEVGSHTYSHVDLDTLTWEEIQQDMVKSHEVIAWAINKEPKRYLRPPRGIINEEIAKAVAACGYKDIIMYGPSALDWKKEKTAKDIADYMLSNTYNGAILLLHMLDDISTPEALPMILEGLQEQGYTFVTVGQLIGDE